MNSSNATPRTTTAGTYWPRWTSALLIATGAIIVLAETTSFLVVAGLVLAGAGVYGLLMRSPAARGS
jgi:hypothetical protein